jgi:mono/diheme cytochrome c family protein
VLAAANASAGPQLDYTLHCMGCHLADGAGAPPEVPALKDRVGYYFDVPGGRQYLVQVPGARQAPLDDAALAALLNWMVNEFAGASLPARLEPFAPEEVTRLRATVVNDIAAERRRLEAAIRERHPGAY